MLNSSYSRVLLAALLAAPASGFAASFSKRPDLAAAQKLQQLRATVLPDEERTVVDSITDFGLRVHNAFVKRDTNTTTSPFSLSSAFGLAFNGAAHDTLTELTRVLALPNPSISGFDTGYAALRGSLRTISRDNVLSFGNAVFTDTSFVLRDGYQQAVRHYLGADAKTVNFEKPLEAAAQINGYVDGQTNHLIPQIVKPETLEGWRTALVNAGYFKGAWDFKFDTRLTREKANFDTGRDIKPVPMMFQHAKAFLYYQGNGFQMASLAYKNGDFAMDLIVPDRQSEESTTDALTRVQSQLTGSNYRQWVASAQSTEITVGLPRFETKFDQDMSDYFKKAMPLAFSDYADFSLLSSEPIKLDRVIHATVLKVNEEGTEGAFATIIGGVRATSVILPPSPRVVADHPFLFVIRHTSTGTPIFVSTVWDPKPLPPPAK